MGATAPPTREAAGPRGASRSPAQQGRFPARADAGPEAAVRRPEAHAASAGSTAPEAARLPHVQREVRELLSRSQAWKGLAPEDRKAFAANMATVAGYLASDPGWLEAPPPPGSEGLAEAMGPVDDLQKRLAAKPGQVDFKANAMREGTEQFKSVVQAVDFPEFVSGLIQGVFQAIVDASIQQMQAYGELLAATAKSVGEFASDHIPDAQVRETIAQRYPSLVKVERDDEGKVRLVPADDEVDTSALQAATRTQEQIDLSSAESEQKFVDAAKLEMARQRQKLMALMVMLGINRIIVTNGRINAKVLFDIRTSDYAKRVAAASMQDTSASSAGAAAAAWAPWGAGGGYAHTSHTTTVRSSVDDTSESKAKMKAQLSGEVRVNFRSETLPPERMLDALQFDQMNYLSGLGAAPAGQPAGGSSASAQAGRS